MLALGGAAAHADDLTWAPSNVDSSIEVSSNGRLFRHVLPDDLLPEGDSIEGALTWRYVGQAGFEIEPSSNEPRWVVESGYRAPLVDRLLETERVDKHGRRWRVVAVDTIELERIIVAYDALAAEPGAESEWEDPYAEPADSNPDEVTAGWLAPNTWQTDPCTYDTIHRWDGDGRSQVSTGSYADGHKGVVQLHLRDFDPFGNPQWGSWSRACTGVMVGDVWVLTAAHCVTHDSTGNPLSDLAVGVCSRGNTYTSSQCQAGVEQIYPGPDWDGRSSGSGADYALVELSAAWTSANPAFYISTTSDLTSIDVHTNYAHPGYATGCASSAATSNNGAFGGTYLYDQVGTVVASTSTLWRSRHDGVGGHSGSPIFYCPAGANNLCATGEPRYVTGVWSGWYTDQLFTHGFRGPKGSVLRSWALAIMD